MPKPDTYSISALSRITGLDRATITKRLEDVEHTAGPKGAKTYGLEDAIPALIAGESTELDEAKLKKLQAEAELREMEVKRERGELLPADEVRDYATRLFKSLHNRIALRFPREAAKSLYKAESQAQITEILRRDLGRIFNEIRDDHTSLL